MGHRTKAASGELDVLLIGALDGSMRFVIDRLFEMHYEARSTPGAQPLHAVTHCANPSASFHAVLCAQPSPNDDGSSDIPTYHELCVKVVGIPLSQSGGRHTPAVIAGMTMLCNLGQYISLSIEGMVKEWNTNTTLPRRFIASINETLAEKQEGTLEQNLYHLAMTGHFSPTMTEWLRDELAERVCIIPKSIWVLC